jgi:predicted lipoprotein
MRRRFANLAIVVLAMALDACVPWTVRPIEGEKDAAQGPAAFTAAAFVDSIWTMKLLPAVLGGAVEARTLLDALAASPATAIARHSHKQAGGPAYFIVSGQGVVTGVDTRSRAGLALVDLPPLDRRPDLSIQIGPVLRGVSLRDSTGIIRFSEFRNQLEFADVGNELNRRVFEAVLTPMAGKILAGKKVSFTGTLAAEENAEPPLRELVPVRLVLEDRR